jgi:hypothetical protein
MNQRLGLELDICQIASDVPCTDRRLHRAEERLSRLLPERYEVGSA